MVIQYAIFNDIHFPYEDKIRYKKAVSLVQEMPNLRAIYLNGDIAEIESVSTHPKSPTAQKLLLNELDYLNHQLDILEKKFQGVDIHYIVGNHEHRIYRFIRDVAPQMWGMMSEPKLLHFDQRDNFFFHDYGPSQWVKLGMADNLWLRHEPLAGGQMHAKGTAEKSYVSVLYGHTHQYQQYTHKKMGPKPFLTTAMSCGWLGDIKAPCFDYRGSKDNWVSGFTRVDCDEKTGEFELRFIRL